MSPLPDGLIQRLVALAEQDSIRSFSLPFHDVELWKGLLAAQVKRSQVLGVPPVQAMPLIATGGPIPGLRDYEFRGDLDMGGEIYLPKGDSTEPADVFAYPGAHGIDAEHAGKSTNLSEAVFHPYYRERSNFCKCFVSCETETGEISGSRRTVIEGWSLYEAIDPNYIDALRIRKGPR